MNFFIKWFTKPEQETQISKEEEINKISEPIISFVRQIKSNPKRFNLSLDSSAPLYTWWIFKDKKLGKVWEVGLYCSGYSSEPQIVGLPGWVTEEEGLYLYHEIRKIFGKSRRDKLHQLQRERMKRIYN